jgi:hypothetical protein
MISPFSILALKLIGIDSYSFADRSPYQQPVQQGPLQTSPDLELAEPTPASDDTQRRNDQIQNQPYKLTRKLSAAPSPDL